MIASATTMNHLSLCLMQEDNAIYTQLLAAFLKHPVYLNMIVEHGYTPAHDYISEALEMIWPVITREACKLVPQRCLCQDTSLHCSYIHARLP